MRIEKLFVFWSLYGCTDRLRLGAFIKKHKDEIYSAVQEYGGQLRLRRSLIELELGN